jgi:ribosomal protein S18 acetylase RimI-like enzyme
MSATIETMRISADNIDAALALLETVVPPRPSLRRAIENAGEGEGFVVTEAGRAVLAVAASTVGGDPPTTWVRIASALPRDTRRWLEALPLASSALCRSPDPVECTLADWEDGAAAHLETLGLRFSGRTFFMTSRERHEPPGVDLAPPTEAVIRACFEIECAAERRYHQLRSSEPEPGVGDEDAFERFRRSTERFIARGDLFAFRSDGAITGYLLLDENTIDTVVVRPDLQRRGIGSTIVRFACATLQRRGHQLVSLLTSDKNLEAVRLYERHGFRMHCINRWFVRARTAGAPPSRDHRPGDHGVPGADLVLSGPPAR